MGQQRWVFAGVVAIIVIVVIIRITFATAITVCTLDGTKSNLVLLDGENGNTIVDIYLVTPPCLHWTFMCGDFLMHTVQVFFR